MDIKLANLADKYLFSIPCMIFKAHGKKKKEIKNILIIKLWALGDSVVLLPAIKALKDKFPKAQIDVLAHQRNAAIFEGQKFIRKIIKFGAVNIIKMFRKYDIGIDAEPFVNVSAVIGFLSAKYRLGFSHGIRSRLYDDKVVFSKKQHMVQNYLDFARKLGANPKIEKLIPLEVSDSDRKVVDEFMQKNEINAHPVGISAGVAESVKFRMWPVEKMAEFADELVKKGNQVVFLDSKSNMSVIDSIRRKMKEKSIDASGMFSVKQSAELISRCKAFISNDSGLMHISAAMGTRTIGLFGPNTPVLWAPFGKGNVSIFKPEKGCPYIDNTRRELIPKHLTKEQLSCMDKIEVKDVMTAFDKVTK